MQNQNSASLRAGSTKSKNLAKPGFGSNLSKKGFSRLKAPISGTKTSQSEADNGVVIVDGKVRTPKELITKRYKQFTEDYLKLLENKEEQQKKNKEQYQIKPKSSLTSQNDSEMKESSSMNQEKSFMSSNKSEAESENQFKKDSKTTKKDKQELTAEDLQAPVFLQLQQTQTVFTFYLPSAVYKQQNDEVKKRNVYYRQYMQKRIGSDNYIPRPVQTFNYQHKKIVESIDRAGNSDQGVFASMWDLEDVMKLQKKTEFEVLQEKIKKNVDEEFGNYLLNPFSCLSLEKQFIEIHSKYEIPGAAEYILKEKELDKKSKTRKIGGFGHTGDSNSQSGLGQISNAQQISKNDTKNQQSSSYKKQESSQSGNRKGIKTAQLQLQLKQQQQKIQSEQKQLLQSTYNHATTLPSESEQKLLKNQNLEISLKYIDRILNSQTYHKQFILYRNYPQVQFIKKVQQDDIRRNKKREKEKQEVSKEPLNYLFSFKNKLFKNYIVTGSDWNPINKDLLAVTYELNTKIANDKNKNDKKGLLMFWTLKNPAFPEKIFTSQFPFTSCKFSIENPNLIACGSQDGVVSIYDIRKKSSTPIAQNRESLDKHTNAVWDIQWISKGKGGKGETLVSISADGRITEWSMKKGLQCNDLMYLRRLPQNNKKQNVQNMNFRFASGLSFQFLKGQSSMYLATTEQGVIYRCSKSYTQQYLEVYTGHNGPVYKVRANPFFYDIFLTCSADWSCKLWNWRKDQPLNTFQSLDLTDQVIDIEWSPNQSTVFASVCKDGRVQLWDLQKKNMLDPICIKKAKAGQNLIPKTIIRFCKGNPILITGDVNGNIDVYRINRDQQSKDLTDQKSRLVRLLYPNGYTLSLNEQKRTKESQQTEDKSAQTQNQTSNFSDTLQ